jgi:8-oxo-dGTP pyrophosphatase MutT (NUDIX family)
MSDRDIAQYSPITHVHGVVFNTAGDILIGRPSGGGSWTLFGGKIEPGETVEQAWRRELLEEGDVTVGGVYILGVQKVEVPEDLHGKEYPYFQVRCAALLDALLPQTPDPDAVGGATWERKFVPAPDIEQYVLWGENGHAMFEEAMSLYIAELSQTA